MKMSKTDTSASPIVPPRKRNLSSTEKVTSREKRPTIDKEKSIPKLDLTDTAVMSSESSKTLDLILAKLTKLDIIEEKLSHLESIERDVIEVKKELQSYKTSLEFTQG